ncbi:MAG: hypothetical protein RLY82_1180, partial [Pseudomonadota bacterium]
MIQHRVELVDVHAHLFRVALTIPNPAQNQILKLAAWIPGSYLVREFSKQLQALTAKQNGKKIEVLQTDKNTWQFANSAAKPITITYLVYAFDASVRTAYLDGARGFFNGTSVFMRVIGQEDQPQQVMIDLPAALVKWRVATSLRKLKSNIYQADDYDELADSPFEMGE